MSRLFACPLTAWLDSARGWARAIARAMAVLTLLIFVSSAVAESVPPGVNLKGQVVDRAGRPVERAMVTATHAVSGFGALAFTRNDGRFVLRGLPVGTYRLIVQHDDHLPREQQVVLAEGRRPVPLTIVIAAAALSGQPMPLDDVMPRNYSMRTVWYGTNRRATGGVASKVTYGSQDGELSLGVCEVGIPRDHRMGELESPVGVLAFQPDPERHVLLLRTERLERETFGLQFQSALAAPSGRSALVFVHGFNVSFEDAARRTAQIAYDLQFSGPAMFFSWPSSGNLLDYAADGEQASRATTSLAEFLGLVLSDPQLDQVHLIAHSMGNRVLTGALQALARTLPAQPRPRIGQIALAAHDIDAEVFRTEIAPQIVSLGQRTTMYASTRDMALLVSRKKNGAPRAGDLTDGVTVVSGMDTIDASAVDTSFLGHSYLAENRSVLADVFALLRHNEPPTERFGMRPRRSSQGAYWVFAR
jgi:esterase/lipase superfamily enzyme